MRVAIDCRFADSPTGLGRFSRELTTALLSRHDGIEYVLIVRSSNEQWLKGLKAEIVAADVPHYSIREQREMPHVIRAANCDLFFSLHFNVPWRCPVPFVATIHDLILHHFPNDAGFAKRAAYRILMHRTVRRAAHIVTVTDFVREELAHAYGSDVLKKTTRVYEGVPEAFTKRDEAEQQRVRNAYGLQRPFFLYVGNAKEHKNVQTLIDAFVRADLKETDLVLVSGGSEATKLRVSPSVRVFSDVMDGDMPGLYSAATAFASASLYEGFGLPALEALHCGCPVMVSAGGAMEEIVGEHGTLVEPTRAAFSEAFKHPPTNTASLAKRWTWQETARLTALLLLDVGENVTDRSSR